MRLLFATIARLRERRVAIIYISHRMEEIEEISDRATVMRNVRVAGTVDPRTATRQYVIELMVGRAEDEQFGHPAAADRGGCCWKCAASPCTRAGTGPGGPAPRPSTSPSTKARSSGSPG